MDGQTNKQNKRKKLIPNRFPNIQKDILLKTVT